MARGSVLECCQGAIGGCGAVILFLLIIVLMFSGVAIGIADIVIGAKWAECHMNEHDADIYLIVSGAVLLSAIVVGNINDKTKESENDAGRYALLTGLLGTASFGILCWGMDIIWDQEQGDCLKGQFDYLYYRTAVIMWMFVTVIGMGILAVLGGVFCAGARGF